VSKAAFRQAEDFQQCACCILRADLNADDLRIIRSQRVGARTEDLLAAIQALPTRSGKNLVKPGEPGMLEAIAETLIDEYIRLGWDEGRLLMLFRNPFFFGAIALTGSVGRIMYAR